MTEADLTTTAALAGHGYNLSVDGVARTAGVHRTTGYRRRETEAVLHAAHAG
ncbi:MULTISPECIES: hypothetical protein [unclassified Pseudonocardia]|jgi:hypothetical protein|uniref:hypothetical protein n=1 Tax=unclassified Pseudonocardia TaxID=2619320 RepID=UPI001ACC34C5|nr:MULTISPECIES: hypothetical protein [unclassified Pseudonocardia]MBN9099022.1 hypothetical protein [Pseudonocardia sp.]